MLIDELNAYIAKQVENVDVSDLYDQIKKVAFNQSIRFYSVDLIGLIGASPELFVTNEQIHKLKQEGFNVETVINAMGSDYFNVTW